MQQLLRSTKPHKKKTCVVATAAPPEQAEAATDNSSSNGAGRRGDDGQGARDRDRVTAPKVPSHWEEQMRTAPMGKRRVLQR